MADKSLGQHWLFDKTILKNIAQLANAANPQTIVEIGPGLGTLTEQLVATGKPILAIELDSRLVEDLKSTFTSREVTVIEDDVRHFDFSKIRGPYTIAANIPYYLTSHLLQMLSRLSHKPLRAVLLVQKEVAERIAAPPGKLTILGVSMQLYAQVGVGDIVPARLFSPPPKVDSQIVVLDFYQQPLYEQPEEILTIVKAGFSAPRKKLRSSLSGGMGVSVEQAEQWLQSVHIDPSRRAQTVSLEEWSHLTRRIRRSS